MAPIKTYTQSPINAASADGVTPRTAPPSGNSNAERQTAPAVTSVGAGGGDYRPAKPGASPFLPAPTGTAQSQRYSPVQPTRTQAPNNENPAPPQPGAFPTPPGTNSSIPPPPRAGEPFHPPVQASAPQMAGLLYPSQMGIPAPTMPYAQRGTMPAANYNTALSEDDGISHPPGYHQNPNASEFSSHQRVAHSATRESSQGGSSSDFGEEGLWDSARKFVMAAGDKLSAAESEVWKRINKE